MVDRVRIVIVDDHPLFREGVAARLRSEPVIEIAGQGASADDAVQLCERERPHVVLLDIGIPGDGLTAARRIANAFPQTRIAILTASDLEEHVSTALDIGVRGYILKGIEGGDLINTMLAIARGDTYVTPGLAARILSTMRQRAMAAAHEDISSLTPREDEILALVAEGRTNKEIARTLAWMPSPGILMSMTMRSGWTRWANSTAPSAVAAIPTTSNPATEVKLSATPAHSMG